MRHHGARALSLAILVAMVVGCQPVTPTLSVETVTAAPSATPTAALRATSAPTPEQAPASAESPAGARVYGYLGQVRNGASGTAADDYVQFLPQEQIPAYGIAGDNAALEERLAAARAQAGSDSELNLYGTFVCGVEDVNGCRLEVDYIRLPTEQTNPEPVGGLQGRLVSLGGAAQYDDKLVLAGPLPVEIGITSAIFENGYPMLTEALAALRDTDTVATLDGQLISGADDVNGVQLQVSAVYIAGQAVDPLDKWREYEDQDLGLTLRYPPGVQVEREAGPFMTLSWDDVSLVIGSRQRTDAEAIVWGRTESLTPLGEALIAGAREAKLGWQVDGRLLGIRYGETTNVRDGSEIQRGNRLLTASLWQLGENWFAKGDLSAEAQQRADIILSTLELTDGEGDGQTGLPNPASVYCVEQGGELEIRTDAEGGQYGVCLFADGSECDEWALYRGECAAPIPATPTVKAPVALNYVQEALGWGLQAPVEWTIQDSTDYVLLNRQADGGDYMLFIGARPEGATEPVFRTGMPEGELQPAGQVAVFNYQLPRQALVYEGKVKVITYGVVRSGGVEFYCYLDAVQQEGQTYADLDIPAAIQAEADAIVSSLAFTR